MVSNVTVTLVVALAEKPRTLIACTTMVHTEVLDSVRLNEQLLVLALPTKRKLREPLVAVT